MRNTRYVKRAMQKDMAESKDSDEEVKPNAIDNY